MSTSSLPPRRIRRILVVLALVFAAAVAYGSPGPAGPLPGRAGQPHLAAGGALAVYFTTPELRYPDVPRNRVAPSFERALLADIAAARERIELASFEYNLASVAEALIRARARGVRVRLALDRESLHHPAMARWAGLLEETGASVSWERSDGFLHSKFVILDRQVVWTGSWNVTVNDTYRNNNNLLRITTPQVVANYVAEFERMAAGRFGSRKGGATPYPLAHLGGATIATFFSPHEPVREHILDHLARAWRSVDVLAFSFTDDAIAEALINRHRLGVPVRVVFEARNANGSGSEYARLRAAGLDVRRDGNCHTMHHKAMILDGRVIITGSYNFTRRAEEVNDENLLIIEDPVLARAFAEEFTRVYRQARVPARCA